MVFHGFSPDGFNIATIQPLIKDQIKYINNSDNYRAIALSSALAKVFDWIIIINNPVCLKLVICNLVFSINGKNKLFSE